MDPLEAKPQRGHRGILWDRLDREEGLGQHWKLPHDMSCSIDLQHSYLQIMLKISLAQVGACGKIPAISWRSSTLFAMRHASRKPFA